jgi:ACS family sodium-dependent inorganic phosphate cotransporter
VMPIPWSQLLRRPAIWAAILTLFCGNWGLYFLLAWLPSYFRDVQGVSITAAGLFAAAPWIGYFVFNNLVASLGDAALKRGADITRTRKTVLFSAFLLAAVFLLVARDATSAVSAMLLLFCSAGALGAASSAYSPNFLELLPGRGAGFIAFGNTIATVPGIVGVATTGWIVDRTGSYTAAFALAAAVILAGAIFYLAFGSGRPIQTRAP